MALDEATTGFLTQMAAAGGPPLHEMTPQEGRALTATLGEMFGEGPAVSSVVDEHIEVDGGTILARVIRPTESPRGVLVYCHGGGWVIGYAPEFDTLGRVLATKTGMTVVLVDYRLAPEHRYPTAVDDSWAALQWVDARRAELASGGDTLVVAGDSAGGNLSAVMAQRAKTAGGPHIDLQVLVYPVTDCNVDNETYLAPENQLMLSRDSMIWFWDHYIPDAGRRTEPDASPARAADLSGLPPAVVITAEHDPLRQEGEEYAQKLRESGVDVQFERFAGQMHGFFTMVNVLPGSAASIDYVADAIDKHVSAKSG